MKISIYNVEDVPIGSGGMGTVYKGVDPQGNTVAVKVMRAELVTDRNLRERFHREIKILNQLEHPFIVKTYASFEDRGNLCLVMEYVEGETVEHCVKRRGIMPESEALRLLREILSALDYAHRQGYVHRDVKPNNIMIRPDGRVCLLDFGIAKDMSNNGGFTVGQQTIGTDGYMSPEQAEGLTVDFRTDIYSLGCVLFYMLTGRHAIQKRTNDHDTRMTVIQGVFPRAKDYNPHISDPIQLLLDRATHKNMLMRFQSCREFELELSGSSTVVNGGDDYISVGKENCNIIVFHPEVSRHHLDIHMETGSESICLRFRDRSTNGTVINGEKIHHREKEIRLWNRREYQDTVSVLLAGKVELKWEEVWKAFAEKRSVAKLSAKSSPATEPTPPSPVYEPKPATGWLVAIYLFAVLGGWLGIVFVVLGGLGIGFGISVYSQKVEFADGRKVPKYKESHRTAALYGAILSVISMFIWIIVTNT
jgi:serine/threonine-protein kinase